MSYQPQWRGVFENYARQFAHDNHWRVRNIVGGLDDAVQECAVVFCHCCKLYGDAVDNPAWFMALFKRSLANRFVSLARAEERYCRFIAQQQPLDEIEPATAPFVAKLAGMSRELQQVLQAIGTAPRQLLQLLLPDWPFSAADEIRVSRSWCRLARTATVRDDLVRELRWWLTA
jgi:hypothetical protein